MKFYTLVLSAALLPITQATAESKSGLPLFAQTHNENVRISEGYANPTDALALAAGPPTASNRNSGFSDENEFFDEIWVSDVDTTLFNDSDGDGYFAGFSVALDVDVTRDYAHVFANIYLQPRGAAPELFHSTNVFTIYAQDSSDRYRVEVDLTDNVFAGDYDLIIDVVDSYSLQLADTVSHQTHSNLSRLPLESQDNQYDQSFNDPYDDHPNVVTSFTVSASSGINGGSSNAGFGVSASVTEFRGGAGWGMLSLLAAAGVVRAKRQRVKFPQKH